MKRLVCLILAAAVILCSPAAFANDVTGTAFKMMFLSEMQYYGSGAAWTESQSGNVITESTYLNGNQYSMRVYYRTAAETWNGVEKAYELVLTGPFSELQPDYDPYTEYGSGYSFRPGLNFYTAFFYAVYDLGIMPDNDNCGTFFEAGLLSPYGIYGHLTSGGTIDYDRNTWASVSHSAGRLETVHLNGVRVNITGNPGGNYEVRVTLP